MLPTTSSEDEIDLKLRDFEKKLDLVGKAENNLDLEDIYEIIGSELESKEQRREVDFRENFLATFVKNLIRHSFRPTPESEKKEFILNIRPRSVLSQLRERTNKRFVKEIDDETNQQENIPQITATEEKEVEEKETEEKQEEVEEKEETNELKEIPRIRRVPIKRLPKRTFTPIQGYRIRQRIMPRTQQQIRRPMQNQQIPNPQTQQSPQNKRMPQQNTNVKQQPQQAPIPMSNLSMEAQTPDVSEALAMVNMGRITNLLQDPSIFSMECPGPGKNILVNKAGRVQTTSITLSTEEINAIIRDISERTKIPLLGGLFKAAIGNILITAIISDYIGTRFVFQKRMPFKG